MPLPGGDAAKRGNHYEYLWTVRCMLMVLNGEANSIQIEPPGLAGQGIEFRLNVRNGVELHQVKRQSGSSRWTLTSLQDVLEHFGTHLRSDPAVSCVFVSQDAPSDLRELTDQATAHSDFAEFERVINGPGNRREGFSNLAKIWNSDARETHTFLKRIRVEGAQEVTLNKDLLALSRTVVTDEPEKLIGVLAMWASTERNTLGRPEILKKIQDKGFYPQNYRDDPTARTEIERNRAAFLNRENSNLINNRLLPQIQFDEIKQVIECAEKRLLLLTGDAGYGKSALLFALTESMTEAGFTVLPLSVNRPKDIGNTAKQLGKAFDLPGSPAAVLGQFAHDSPSLLILDQVDYLSISGGRRSENLDAILEVIEEARNFPSMRVLLACRSFDANNDDRLMPLFNALSEQSHKYEVGPLDLLIVRNALESHKVNPDYVSEATLELLRTPLHLKLYMDAGQPESPSSVTELYEAWVKAKERNLSSKGFEPAKWKSLVDEAVRYMSVNRSLSMPKIKLDEDTSLLEGLCSEGIFTRSQNEIQFFHESCHDYFFARNFYKSEHSLVKYLLRFPEQGLYLRTTVRQVFEFLRLADPKRYATELKEFIGSTSIRFHLKRVVLNWLQTHREPLPCEWNVVQSQIQLRGDANVLYQRILRSEGWFLYAFRHGHIATQLGSDNASEVESAVENLAHHVSVLPDEIASLSIDWLGLESPWPERAKLVFEYADVIRSTKWIEFYELLLKTNDASATSFPLRAGGLSIPTEHPETALTFLRLWLTYHINQPPNEEGKHFLNRYGDGLRRHHSLNNAVIQIARDIPASFLQEILPPLLQAIKEAESTSDLLSFVLQGQFEVRNLADELEVAIYQAFESLPVDANEIAIDIYKMLEPERALPSVQHMLRALFCARPKPFVNEAVNFLLEHGLELTYDGDYCWGARKILEQISPICSETQFRELEKRVLEFDSAFASDLGGAERFEHRLLTGLSQERLSPDAHSRKQELERKFGPTQTQPIRGGMANFVGPPFNANWEKMSLNNWIKTMRKYDKDLWSGGMHELGQVFSREVQREPTKFARFSADMLSKDVNPHYHYALLLGFTGVINNPDLEIPVDAIWETVRNASTLRSELLDRQICSLIYQSNLLPPPDIRETVYKIIKHSSDPENDPVAENGASFFGNLDNAGLNSVRGGAAWAVARILQLSGQVEAGTRDAIKALVTDTCTSVRCQAMYPLLYLLYFDSELAKSLFSRCVNGTDLRIWESKRLVEFAFEAARFKSNTEFAADLIHKLLEAGSADSLEHAGMVAAVLYILHGVREPLDACLEASVKAREGVAQQVNVQCRRSEHLELCRDILARLFTDEADSVRVIAARCFFTIPADRLMDDEHFLRRFIESPAFEHCDDFFDALKGSPNRLPSLILQSYQKFGQILESKRPIQEQNFWFYGRIDPGLLIRLYNDTEDAELRSDCLDLIDRLAKFDSARDLDLKLSEYRRA